MQDMVIRAALPAPYETIHIFERSKNYCLEKHHHTGVWHVNFVTDGCVTVAFEDKNITVYKNQLFIVPANVPHSLQSNDGYRQIGVDINMSEESHLYQLLTRFDNTSVTAMSVHATFGSVDEAAILLQHPTLLNITLFLNRFESMLLEGIAKQNAAKPSFYNTISKILSQNNPLTLTLNDICRMTSYSKTQIERMSNKELGCGMTTYLNRIKINRICMLLQETNLSCAEIAEQVGLCDASHLSVFFKRFMGITPGKFRKK